MKNRGDDQFFEFVDALKRLYGKDYVDWLEDGHDRTVFVRAGMCTDTQKRPAVLSILFSDRLGWHPVLVSYGMPLYHKLVSCFYSDAREIDPVEFLGEENS